MCMMRKLSKVSKVSSVGRLLLSRACSFVEFKKNKSPQDSKSITELDGKSKGILKIVSAVKSEICENVKLMFPGPVVGCCQ